MTADVFTTRSRNPHADCRAPGGFPCRTCRDRQREEQEARDRHPAGSDVMPASNWLLRVEGSVIKADFVDVDSELIEDLAEKCAQWLYADEQGLPEIELARRADDIRDLLTVDLNRAKALAVAMALQNHASRLPVED